MKKIRFLSSILAFSLVFCTCLSVPASATNTNDNEAIVLSQEEIDKLPDAVLVGTQILNFIIDDEGSLIDIVEGDVPASYSSAADWNGQYHTARVNLFKSGKLYYVSLNVSAATNWWITKVRLEYRPAGVDDLETIEKSYTNKPTTAVLKSPYFSFLNSVYDVEVMGYIAVKSTGVLDKEYSWYGPLTLTTP